MYDFPPGLYTDVRVEKVFETEINFIQEDLQGCRIREHETAFIRILTVSAGITHQLPITGRFKKRLIPWRLWPGVRADRARWPGTRW